MASVFAGVKQEIDVKAGLKDQSGKTIKVQVREDEEQKEKLSGIIDLLLAAGYFRARISSLPVFDKVVGGLVWCISTCNVDLDVDLLYQENSTIGQKIALVEKIVAVLPRMKCPHDLQPHQIQGMDSIRVFPVVQWLVKKAMQRREETAQYIRSFSEMQFNKVYTLPCDAQLNQKVLQTAQGVEAFKESHKPMRIYKKPSNTRKLDIKLQAQSTLLEYGKLDNLLESSQKEEVEEVLEEGEQGRSKSPEEQEKQKEKEKTRKLLNESNLKELLKNMTQAAPKPSLSTAIGSILHTQSSEIAKVVDQYEEQQAELHQESGRLDAQVQQHERVMRSLNKQIETATASLIKHADTVQSMKERYVELTSEISELDERTSLANSKIKEIELQHESNTNIDSADKAEIERQVVRHEELVKAQTTFKKQCMDQIKVYKEQIVEERQQIESLENNKRTKLVNKQYEKDKAKLDKLRLQVAKKNYTIAALQRQVDEVPTRIELLQYQKRFEELHHQTSKVHTETKQFYTLFNNLSDTKTYLEKHLIRLNSINDNFKKAMSNIETGMMFLDQFEQLVEGTKQGKISIEKKRAEVKSTKDGFNDQYLELVEEQRQYYQLVKEFNDECCKNEVLIAKCKEYKIDI